MNLLTCAKNTWCPGCGDFGILAAVQQAIPILGKRGIKQEEIVVVGGIGCGAKIIDYLNLNSFSALHGRPVPSAEGIKIGNPNLTVIVFGGDGGLYNEGISHLIHAAKRNSDITVIVHDNRNFALTTSQFTMTSPEGFKGKSTPFGSIEEPLNPLKIMLSAKASFIARGYSMKVNHLRDLIVQAVSHKGFSFVEVLQPCVTFFNTTQDYNQGVYEINNKNLESEKEALNFINEWDYQNLESKIPIGLFYKKQRSVYE